MKAFLTCVYSPWEFFLIFGTEEVIKEFQAFRQKVDEFCICNKDKENISFTIKNLQDNKRDYLPKDNTRISNLEALFIENDKIQENYYHSRYKLYDLILGFNNNDQIKKWGRAIILNINSDSLATITLKLFFIDYGNIEDVNITKHRIFAINEIPNNISLYPQCITPCTLYGLGIKDCENSDLNKRFCDIIRVYNENLDIKLEMHSTGEYHRVSLFLPDKLGNKTMVLENENTNANSIKQLLVPTDMLNNDPNLIQLKCELKINTWKGLHSPLIIA